MISTQRQGGITHQQAVASAPPHRVATRPISEAQAKDPRGYQVNQLRRRYSPRETTLDDGTLSLVFRIKPSDPDFPYDLDHLECDLRVPGQYPAEPPVLMVQNKNIPKGFSINIEKGWDNLVQQKPGATLLALSYALDKNLEAFLSEQKTETVKLTIFKDTRHLDSNQETSPQGEEIQIAAEPTKLAFKSLPAYVPEEFLYTQEQIAEAKTRRTQETRQLETRMSKLSLYRRSVDGIVYTLPLDPKRRSELPSGLQAVKTLHLIVPLLYPLQPVRVQLNEVDSHAAEPLEDLFLEKSALQQHMSLTSHLNYLAQNMHTLAKQAEARSKPSPLEEGAAAVSVQKVEDVNSQKQAGAVVLADRTHIKVIPRPPEWSYGGGGGGAEGSSSEDDSFESDDDSATGGAAVSSDPLPLSSFSPLERGIALTFPGIELYNIELFHVASLSLTIKCERCKTINEITGLKPSKDAANASTAPEEKTGSCRKCAAGFAARFRAQLLHQNSNRAGFIDLVGATVSDMLPSTFVPVCAKCSTPSPGLVSVRGESTTNVCRDCHGKFTFKIPDVRFLAYAPSMLSAPAASTPRKREKLGLTAGEPLPGKGACSHYRKSFRWFRFSCCDRVHPCDKCHDEAEDHENEWANRMVCGWCSREQRYAVELCGFCGRSVIGRKGRGFWEGGKGTRDRTLMSRKDKRKHKRVGGGEAAKKD